MKKKTRQKKIRKPVILVTNDDGIYSPGIASLAKVASRFGEVRVVAPDVEQSSMGHAITATRPLFYKKSPIAFEGLEAYRVNGTPADCVALGSHLWDKVDVVLSGINLGLNLGNAMWHSGTLAGAKQAVLLGMKGIAFSTPTGNQEPDFPSIEPYVEKALDLLLDNPDLCLINVNLPAHPPRRRSASGRRHRRCRTRIARATATPQAGGCDAGRRVDRG